MHPSLDPGQAGADASDAEGRFPAPVSEPEAEPNFSNAILPGFSRRLGGFSATCGAGSARPPVQHPRSGCGSIVWTRPNEAGGDPGGRDQILEHDALVIAVVVKRENHGAPRGRARFARQDDAHVPPPLCQTPWWYDPRPAGTLRISAHPHKDRPGVAVGEADRVPLRTRE